MPHSADDTRTRRYGWRDPRPGAAAAQRMSGLDYMTAMMKGEIAAGPIMDTLAFRLTAVGDGFATFELESLQLGPIAVPLALVEQAVAAGTKNAERPEGVDIHAPFRLPYQVRRVRLLPGRAVVEY